MTREPGREPLLGLGPGLGEASAPRPSGDVLYPRGYAGILGEMQANFRHPVELFRLPSTSSPNGSVPAPGPGAVDAVTRSARCLRPLR